MNLVDALFCGYWGGCPMSLWTAEQDKRESIDRTWRIQAFSLLDRFVLASNRLLSESRDTSSDFLFTFAQRDSL